MVERCEELRLRPLSHDLFILGASKEAGLDGRREERRGELGHKVAFPRHRARLRLGNAASGDVFLRVRVVSPANYSP